MGMQHRSYRTGRFVVFMLAGCAALAGCVADKPVISVAHTEAASGLPLPPPGVCTRGKVCIQAEQGTDKVDLLFMIDNSNSMKEEQAALLEQIPVLIEALSSGDVDGDGTPEFGAMHDLHVGAVTSDMGLVGVGGVDNCTGFGDDGLLQHTPRPEVQDCARSYPTFLSFSPASAQAPKDFAHDFACIATVGTGGCGFEQQLEAPLKALSPSFVPQHEEDLYPKFLADMNGLGSTGHGDTENAGFLRTDPKQGLPVLGIILITDEEDGSSADTHHLIPPTYLDPSDPLAMEPLNLRDFFHPEELYPVERYVTRYKALRRGHEDLVVFGAITGVPPDLVDADAIAKSEQSAKARGAFYDEILADERMKERIDPGSMTTPGTGSLIAACDTPHGKAYPARRIVETARGFGQNGFVQSICEDDYRPAVRELAKRICRHVTSGCIRHSLARGGDGLATCDLRVVLGGDSGARCEDLGAGASDGGKTKEPSSQARRICNVAQIAAGESASDEDGGSAGRDQDGESGWYYDDVSKAAAQCGTDARVALSGIAMPRDAELYLDCE
jgi:hypothetical protein